MFQRIDKMGMLLGLQVLALWPVWRWYLARLTDRSDEPWGLLAAITALGFVLHIPKHPRISVSRLRLPAMLMLLYGLAFGFVSPLIRGLLAMTALAATLSSICLDRKMHLALWGLLVLSLPLMASLQFYLGYPLRILVSHLSAPLLQISGIPVVLEGTRLIFNGQQVWIDAPCSGIRMLWTGTYLALTLACLYKMSTRQTLMLLVAEILAVILGNVMRAAGLFFIEVGIVASPTVAHSAMGVAVFAITSLAIVQAAAFIRKGVSWDSVFSFS